MTATQAGTDRINRVEHTTQKAQAQWPGDVILLSTSANVLKSKQSQPVGWSLSRLRQLRCNAVFTDQRVFVETSTRSRLLPVWLLFGGVIAWSAFTQGNLLALLALLPVAVLILQRRPFSREFRYADLSGVALGEVRGVSGVADIISLTTGPDSHHLTLSQRLPDELIARLSR